ncbi:MAG: hypothetical protein ACRC1H_12765, partial [Caldilineaceae bacterium]
APTVPAATAPASTVSDPTPRGKRSKSGGMGRAGFFQATGVADDVTLPAEAPSPDAPIAALPPADAPAAEALAADGAEEPAPAPDAAPAKAAKVRTTIMLTPAAASALDLLRLELRRGGEKVTYSEVLELAIAALVEKQGLRI